MTLGKLHPSRHRVEEILEDRYSLTYFYEPKYTARMPKVLPTLQKKGQKREHLIYGKFLVEHLSDWVEYRGIKYKEGGIK